MRAASELLGAPTFGGGSARPGGVGGGSPRSKICKPSKPPEIYENVEKMGGFTHFLAYKSLKTPFLIQKYLTRYISEMFFEEYINFKIFHY